MSWSLPDPLARSAGAGARLALAEGQPRDAIVDLRAALRDRPGSPDVVALLFDEAAARDFIAVQGSNLMPQASIQGQAFRFDNQTQPHTRITGGGVFGGGTGGAGDRS